MKHRIHLLLSSTRADDSYSSKVAWAIVDRIRQSVATEISVRDLCQTPVPHPSANLIAALMKKQEELNAEDEAALELSNELIAELLAADTLIIASPMHNFGVPSVLKSWFDHVLRAGVTFRLSERGYIGLLPPKKVFLVLARGGTYDKEPLAGWDYQEPYLRMLLGFIGLNNIDAIAVDGVNLGIGAGERALAAAMARVSELLQ